MTTNSRGWEVQKYTLTHGWRHDSITFRTKAEAAACMAAKSGGEYRVYEVLG